MAFAVAAYAQLRGKIARTGKLSGRFVGQMAGRTNTGLGHGLALKVLFIRPGKLQIVHGIGNRLFIRVTVQAKSRFFIVGYQQGRLGGLVFVDLMAGQAY